MPAAALRRPQSPANTSLAVSVVCFWLLACVFAAGQVQVTTEHNDVFRDGANIQETVLTPSNVNFNTFGKLFTQSVDGFIVGQPLYLSGQQMADGLTHNVVYVATQHDSVYAFDADSVQAPLWKTSFINPTAGITTVPMSDYGCGGTAFNEIGIVSTPVIDPTTSTLFVLAKTLENGTYVFRLHALSTITGADLLPAATISASVQIKTGTLQFNPAIQMQRPALLLSGGTIYIGFGSNGCDTYAYHGWLLAYNETTLQPVGTFSVTPNGKQGAIWQGGGGPAADENGDIFLATGNGTFDANTGGTDYGDSLLHLSPASEGLQVLDYFTPYDEANLAANDLDLGSGGVVVLPDQSSSPHTYELIGGGKEGTLYLVDRDNMGGFNSSGDTEIVQSVPQASKGELTNVPGYWNGNVYISGQFDHIKAFSLVDGALSAQPTSQTSITSVVPGAVSISANGTTNGIVWVLPLNNPATLYAYDATNLANVFYSSAQAPSLRDKVGAVPKFGAPTIANGKVYIGGTNALTVYGLLPLISPATGNNQSAYVGTTLTVPLQLKTVDDYQGNPIPNVSVTCKDGGVYGVFSAVMPMVTDSTGQASTYYTLPKKAQTVTITCTNAAFQKATFTENAIAGPVSRAVIVSGNRQSALVSSQLPTPLVMQVLDPYGYGVPSVPVTFSDGGAGGTFSAASVVADSLGRASTLYTLPSKAGTYTITASFGPFTPVKFAETAGVPGFTLAANPNALTLTQGGSVQSTITVTPTFGFTGTINLTASTLPSGVTASFSPSSTTGGASTLTLKATSTAALGTFSVTVTGTSGATIKTMRISLTVN